MSEQQREKNAQWQVDYIIDEARKAFGLTDTYAPADLVSCVLRPAAEMLKERDALRDENKRLRGAIVWALGYTDFLARKEGEGPYWWRPELRRRAALTPEQIEQALAALTPQAGKGGGE